MQDDFIDLQDHSIDLQDVFIDLQDNFVELQDRSIGMQDVFVELQDHSIELQDVFVELQDHSIGMQDDFVKLQSHSIGMQNVFVDLQDRSINLQNVFVELQDHSIDLQNDFVELQKILLTYLQAASPTAKASSFILGASNATAAIFCVNSLFSTKFCAGSSKKAISFSSFAPACSAFTPSLHLPTEKSSEVGSPSVKHQANKEPNAPATYGISLL